MDLPLRGFIRIPELPHTNGAPLICDKFKTLTTDTTIEGIKFINANELNIFILKSLDWLG